MRYIFGFLFFFGFAARNPKKPKKPKEKPVRRR
jgi:hypothetical protein